MTGPSSTQIVSVSLALAGEQTARIDTNHAGTPQARLHILWGVHHASTAQNTCSPPNTPQSMTRCSPGDHTAGRRPR